MRFYYFLLLSICIPALWQTTSAQNDAYRQKIAQHRQLYKNEFLADQRSPLSKADTGFLQFYPPYGAYLVQASFVPVNDDKGFDMQTHNGVIKRYFVYGYVEFTLQKKLCKLFVYQSEKLRTQKGSEDHLFMPFTDNTNYTETFGGGRYLDFKISDIREGKLEIDFNKCYNPYCAYKAGYACPIPPKENNLDIAIEAGEKLFGKAPLE